MEKDLFQPIKEYFENYGYICDGEVNDIDLYMEKGDECVAIELKNTLDFKAVQQAALRQKITDYVYIGIVKPRNLYSSSMRDKLYILKRLGIGLILVSARSGTVEIAIEPIVSELSSFQVRNGNKRKALSAEFQKRKTRSNTGGVHRTKLITSYREEALLVLNALHKLGDEAEAKDIRALSGIKKSTSILYSNYYGWFSRSSRGVYRIDSSGFDALKEYKDTLTLLINE
ncbi:MAG: DUF2161 family putative PD-(D/E)XK-type phosphodiesterase [Clostridia bacterium]|nr:DUF2161 family putative PD-(D/E)XK-type phosphodiesterase [Clostridia bacterium]